MRPSVSICKAVLVLTLFVPTYAFSADLPAANNNSYHVDAQAGTSTNNLRGATTGAGSTAGSGLSCIGADVSASAPSVTDVKTALDNDIAALQKAHTEGCQIIGLNDLSIGYRNYVGNAAKCVDNYVSARQQCLETCSASIQQLTGVANMMMFSMNAMSIVEACSSMADTMNKVQLGLTAYSGNCAFQQGSCSNSCSSTMEGLQTMQAALKKLDIAPVCKTAKTNCEAAMAGGPPCSDQESEMFNAYKVNQPDVHINNLKNGEGQAFVKREITGSDTSQEKGSEPAANTIKQRMAACKGYMNNVQSASMGILSAMQNAAKSKECEKKAQSTPDAGVDCTLEKYANNQKCICEKNPRMVGCGNTETNQASAYGATSTPITNTTTAGGGSITNSTEPTARKPGAADAAGDVGGAQAGAAAGGGGTNMDGGGGGSRGDSRGGAPGSVRRLNTGIYGGEGGGGGGGMGGGRAPAEKAKESLVNDPKFREAREKELLRAQIGLPAGKSNWDKVRERYSKQKGTLLAQ